MCDTRDINAGSVIYDTIVKKYLHCQYLGDINMYAKCGFLSTAHELFDDLLVKDASSWNILTIGYVEHG